MPSFHIPEQWDSEADVIVVGAGNAGLPAAITVADKKIKVMALETWGSTASSLAYIIGGTLFAGTDLQKAKGIEDSPEKLFKEAVEITQGSPDLWRVLADRQLETYEWLKGLGAKPIGVDHAPGHKEVRVHRFEGHGGRLLKILRKTAEEKGIKILFKHRAERLVLDPAKGRVIGIRVKHEEKDLHFRARKAVILASGGFIQNREFVKEFGPYSAGCLLGSAPAHFGDGLRMALDIGAATADIGAAASPSISVCTTTNLSTRMHGTGGIAVNEDGKRWADEVGPPYNIMMRDLILRYPDGLHFVIYDSKIRQEATPEAYQHVKEYKADTIEELARAAGLNPEALAETISEYNSDIDKYGYDKKFGRSKWGGTHGMEPVPKIDTPPFYAVICKVALSSCKGGVKINPKAQVVDQFGDVIPGLYAAGEVTGGLFGKPEAYYAGTMTLMGFVFGRVAGENAAAEGKD